MNEYNEADLGNIQLRHAMLSSVHSVLKNYMLCMDRNYFGSPCEEERNLADNLHKTMKHVENVMNKYYNEEAAILEH